MKKVIAFVAFVLTLLPICAIADIDLSVLTIDELITLQTSIVGELMERDEIKTVTVPAGEYIVGEDLPAGKYSVETKASLAILTVNEYEDMYSVNKNEPIGKLTLKDGDILALSSSCDFSVYSGLGF